MTRLFLKRINCFHIFRRLDPVNSKLIKAPDTLKEKNIKILLIGSEGQLGWEIKRQGKLFDFEIIGVDLPHLDITDASQVKTICSACNPSVVVNAAAYTNVDKAESEPGTAFAVNSDGPENIAVVCADAGVPLIHISTDYVFDGSKGSPYIETDRVSPMGVYGKSKEKGETRVRMHLKEHIIIRTSWMYGIYGKNFVKTMLRLGKERKTISVVADQHGCPTSADDMARTVLTIAGQIRTGSDLKWGTYHYSGKGITTWYKLAQAVFDFAGRYDEKILQKIEPVKTADYPTPAKRPLFSAFDCSLIEKNFGVKAVPWQQSLKPVIDNIKNSYHRAN